MGSHFFSKADLLTRLLDQTLQHSLSHGVKKTAVPFLEILKENGPTLLTQGVLKPSLCILLQGKKKLQTGASEIEYQRGDFLAASVMMPVNGQVVEASFRSPYVALRIDLTPGEVAAVALEADLAFHPQSGMNPCIFVGDPGVEVLEGFEKLLRLSSDTRAARYLAPAIKREIIYWLLEGNEGALFYKNMLLHQEASGISKIIDRITSEVAVSFTIHELADLGNMSVSNLHYKFKEITGLARCSIKNIFACKKLAESCWTVQA